MSEGYTETTETRETPQVQGLDEQLAALKEKQAEAAVDQLDSNIADLAKLIEDTKKAEEDHAKAYDQLKDQATRLKSERDTVKNSLEAALGNAGIEAVRDVVREMVKQVSDAQAEHDAAKDAVSKAQSDADAKSKALATTQADLDMWRKAGDGIGKRLKAAETLLEEIKKLRNASRRGEAYWKLALGDLADVPGQEFLDKLLERQPEVLHPDDLRNRIRESWNLFRAARKESAMADAVLASAQADLKEKEADFAGKTRNLVKAIANALARREDASNAA